MASLAMFACGVLRFPTYHCHKNWTEECCRYANEVLHRLLWQEGLLFAALGFMLMRSARLMNAVGQYVLLGVCFLLMTLAVMLIHIPVDRAVTEKFGGEQNDNGTHAPD